MKIPRSISGEELVKLLRKSGYKKTGQKGSHIKVTTTEYGQHYLAIPNHNPIKPGTFNSIVNQVATHFNKSKEEILESLF